MDSQQPMDHLPNSEGVDGNENGAEQEQNYPSSVLEVQVLMAKLVGLPGWDFMFKQQQDGSSFGDSDNMGLIPSDEVLFAECQRRAQMFGTSFEDVMREWLRENPIKNHQPPPAAAHDESQSSNSVQADINDDEVAERFGELSTNFDDQP